VWVEVLYDLAVAAHVLTVLGALVAIAVAGGYQVAAAAGADNDSVARYFRAGPSWGPRLLAPAALLGLLAAGLSRGRIHLGAGWVWGAGLVWLVAMGAVEALLRPAEKALAAAGGHSPDDPEGAGGPRVGPCRSPRSVAIKGLTGAVLAVAGVVVASVLMTVQ
jgi:hypothetical protein